MRRMLHNSPDQIRARTMRQPVNWVGNIRSLRCPDRVSAARARRAPNRWLLRRDHGPTRQSRERARTGARCEVDCNRALSRRWLLSAGRARGPSPTEGYTELTRLARFWTRGDGLLPPVVSAAGRLPSSPHGRIHGVPRGSGCPQNEKRKSKRYGTKAIVGVRSSTARRSGVEGRSYASSTRRAPAWRPARAAAGPPGPR